MPIDLGSGLSFPLRVGGDGRMAWSRGDENVRDCLAQSSQRYGIARGHDIYLTDVVEVNVHRSYPDGTATRFVQYRVQGSSDIQSTTCLW